MKATLIKDKSLDKLGSGPAPKEWRKIKEIQEALPKEYRISAFLQKLNGKNICVWMYPNGRGYNNTCSDYFLIEDIY